METEKGAPNGGTYGGTLRETKEERDPRCRVPAHPWRETRLEWLNSYQYENETPQTD